jgi:stage II sporulation protein M
MRPDQERRALTGVLKALKDIPLDASPPVLALTLFYHNARASFFAAAAGWIPFLCLPAFDPLLNGAVLGLVVSIARHMGMNVPSMVLTGIAPHGIFELPAILYVTSVGVTVSLTLGKKILASHPSLDRFRRKGRAPAAESEEGEAGPRGVEALPGIRELAAKAVRSFGLVVLPLLLVAAVIEAFVTSQLF